MTLLFVKKENPQKTMQNHNHFIFIILLTSNGVINISNDQLQVDKKLLIIPFPNFKKK